MIKSEAGIGVNDHRSEAKKVRRKLAVFVEFPQGSDHVGVCCNDGTAFIVQLPFLFASVAHFDASLAASQKIWKVFSHWPDWVYVGHIDEMVAEEAKTRVSEAS